MNLLGVETTVRDRLGLDPGSLGPVAFPRAVEARMRVRGSKTPEAYLGVLTADPDEPIALAAEMVVPETWFFRGGRPLFDRLAEFVAARAAESPSRPVRILSVPCSTGEEPYSLAIALHEHLVPPDRYTIDAIDLSPVHLDRAMAGRFAPFAFREGGLDIRPAYFRQEADRWVILPHFRDAVRFRVGNATDPAFLTGEPPYDLVLCRNLFIYLTPEGRTRGMAALDRLLAFDGRLCLTPGEADRLPPGTFRLDGPGELGVYRRVGAGSKPHLALLSVPSAPAQTTPVAKTTRVDPAPVTERVTSALPTTPPPSPPKTEPSLEAVRALADAGHLREASGACERLVTRRPDCAEAYSLLGVIAQAEGRSAEAAEAFRRALYLDPRHAEALTHMIVVCERSGDHVQAAALRLRLSRLSGGAAS